MNYTFDSNTEKDQTMNQNSELAMYTSRLHKTNSSKLEFVILMRQVSKNVHTKSKGGN